jgi:hypothetical protein
MKRRLLWLALLLVILSAGCARKEVIELDISDSELEALTPAIETGLVGFYAHKESPPETMDDFVENGKLVTCIENYEIANLTSQMVSFFGISEGLLVLCELEQDCGDTCVETLQENPQSVALVEMGLKIEQRKQLIEVVFK